MKRAGIVLLLATTAHADIAVQGDFPKLTITIGKTVEQNVGHARGTWGCDDTTLVTGELVTRGDSNVWVVTGKKLGSTQCRIGDLAQGSSTVFDVYVVAKTSPRSEK